MKRAQQNSDGSSLFFGVFCFLALVPVLALLLGLWNSQVQAAVLPEAQRAEIYRQTVFEHTRNWNRLETEGQPWLEYSVRIAADYAYVLLSADVFFNNHDVPLERIDHLFALLRQMQDTNPQSKFRGNFRWYWGQDSVKDPNAIEFVLQRLLYCKLHEDRLSTSARVQLDAILQDSVQCELLREVESDYTNIALQNLANLILLGELLENPVALEEGKRRLNRFLCHTYKRGITEYASSTYYTVDICSLAFLVSAARDADVRRKAQALLDYWTCEVAFLWFPGAHRLAGAYSRTYHYAEADPHLRELLQCWGWEPLPEHFTPTVRMLSVLNSGYFPENPLLRGTGASSEPKSTTVPVSTPVSSEPAPATVPVSTPISSESAPATVPASTPISSESVSSLVPSTSVSTFAPRWFYEKNDEGEGEERATYITPEFAMGYSNYRHPDAQNIAFAIDLPERPRLYFLSDIDENPYGVQKTRMKTGHSRLCHFQPDKLAISMDIPESLENAQEFPFLPKQVPTPEKSALSNGQGAPVHPEEIPEAAPTAVVLGTVPEAEVPEATPTAEVPATDPAVEAAVCLFPTESVPQIPTCTLNVCCSSKSLEELPDWDTLKQKKLQSHFVFPVPDEIQQNGKAVPLADVERNQAIRTLSLRYGTTWIHAEVQFDPSYFPSNIPEEAAPQPVVHCVNDDPARKLLRLTIEHGLVEDCNDGTSLVLTFQIETAQRSAVMTAPTVPTVPAVPTDGEYTPAIPTVPAVPTGGEHVPAIPTVPAVPSDGENVPVIPTVPAVPTGGEHVPAVPTVPAVPADGEHAPVVSVASPSVQGPIALPAPFSPTQSEQGPLLEWSGSEFLCHAIPEVGRFDAPPVSVDLQPGESKSWSAASCVSCSQLFRAPTGVLVNDEVGCCLRIDSKRGADGTYEVQFRATTTDAKHNSVWLSVGNPDLQGEYVLVDFPPAAKSAWSKPVTFRAFTHLENLRLLPREYNVQLEEIRITRIK